MVIVYSKPGCPPCRATYRHLDKHDIPYTSVDLSQNPEAIDQIKTLGYNSAPVVVAETTHWCGYRPDNIDRLAQQLNLI